MISQLLLEHWHQIRTVDDLQLIMGWIAATNSQFIATALHHIYHCSDNLKFTKSVLQITEKTDYKSWQDASKKLRN